MPPASGLARFSSLSLVLAIFFIATLVFTFPLSLEPASHALDLGPDTRLFLWTLAWDVHALARSPLEVFDANIFFPEPNTLAYSEHQIGSALIGAPVLLLSNDPLLTMNVVLLLSCFGSGIGAYALARQLGLSKSSAVFCGLVFCLAPPRFFRLGQLHLATVQWLPLCLALLHRYASGGSRRNLVGAAALFSLQAWSGGQSGLFLALSGALLVVYLLTFGELGHAFDRATLRGVLGALLFAVAANVPFVLPYLQVRQSVGLERSLNEAEEWSPNAVSFAASPTHAHRLLLTALGQERRVARNAKAFLFPGLLPLALTVAALSLRSKRRKASSRGAPGAESKSWRHHVVLLDALVVAAFLVAFTLEAIGGLRAEIAGIRLSAASGDRAALVGIVLVGIRLLMARGARWTFRPLLDETRAWIERRMSLAAGFYLLLGALSLWAALGPSFGLYRVLYRLVPGFDFVRVPSRLTLLTVMCLAVLAGIGLQKLSERIRPALRPWFLVAMFAALLAEMAAFPLDAKPYSISVSEMDRFLADRATRGELPRGPIAVLPIPDPRDGVESARRHSTYMLHATVHFLPMVNGYSGFTPPRHDALFRKLALFPNETALEALENESVALVVLHRDGYAAEEWSSMVRRLERISDRVRLVGSFDAGRIYELTRRRPNPPDRGG